MRTLALITFLALSGCSSGQPVAGPDPSALIKTGRVETGSIDEKITIYGAAENGSLGKFTLSSPVEAMVRSVDAPVGSNVGRGQVVVRLAPSPAATLDLVNARTNARAANQAFARAQRLRSDGLVSDAEVESARAARQSADASVTSLVSRSGSLTLRAPVAGFVETIGASAGELVAPGTAVVTIVKDGNLRARFGIDPALARRIPKGSFVEVVSAGRQAPIAVPVVSVDPVVDPQTKLASVYVAIPRESEIGAGESLTGNILLSSNSNGLTLPYAALLDDGGQPYVYVIENGVAKRRDVAVGPRMGDRVSVTNGIKAGDIVATEGVIALEDGMKVRTK